MIIKSVYFNDFVIIFYAYLKPCVFTRYVIGGII